MRLFLGFFSFASPDNSALKSVAFVQYWKIERKEKLDWPWEVSVIWMHVAMSVGPRWWDLWGRNGPWGREGRHHRSWLSGRWKGTPFSVRKSMHGPNQTARLSVFIQVKKKNAAIEVVLRTPQLIPPANLSLASLADWLEATSICTFGDLLYM